MNNSLPNDKFLDWSKLKGFADNKNEWVENIVEKGENAGNQHFLLFPLFSKGFILAGR